MTPITVRRRLANFRQGRLEENLGRDQLRFPEHLATRIRLSCVEQTGCFRAARTPQGADKVDHSDSLQLAQHAKGLIQKLYEDRKLSPSVRQDSEATTRVEVIDKILSALGWEGDLVAREQPSGTGSFLDYELRFRGSPWMVVEAKRAGTTFDLSDSAEGRRDGLTRSMSTLFQRSGESFREVTKQAAGYCNQRAVALACVTNGYQWVFFRGLSSPNRKWRDLTALVFSGPDVVLARFDEFYGCLGKASAGTPYLARLLDTARSVDPPGAVVPEDEIVPVRRNPNADQIAIVRSACSLLLGDIYGHDRGDMLDHCYVQPGAKADFERTIQRLLKDTSSVLEEEVHRGTPKDFVDQLKTTHKLNDSKLPILVVGHVGAGKTTFLHRSLYTLRDKHEAFCAFVDREGHGHSGQFDSHVVEAEVCQAILDQLGRASVTCLGHNTTVSVAERAQADPTDPSTIRTLYRRELEQERKLGSSIWTHSPLEWDRKEYELISRWRNEPEEMLSRYVRHLCGRFRQPNGERKYPVLIVLDNVDQASDAYQRCIYGLAQRIARKTSCLVVLALREDTYTRGKEPGGFLTSSNLQFVFHVACAPLSRVLNERVRYWRYAVQHGGAPQLRQLLSEKATVEQSMSTLEGTMLGSQAEALAICASLAGHSTREGLALIRAFLLGSLVVAARPGCTAAFAIECLLASRSYDDFEDGLHLFNCLDAEPTNAPTHGLRSRLLAYFSYAFDDSRERQTLEHRGEVLARFSSWGYEVAQVERALQTLLQANLLRPSDRAESRKAEIFADLPPRITITASGHVHLKTLLRLPAYRAAMALGMRWYDPHLARQFIERASSAGGEDGPTIADITASSAMHILEAYLTKSVATEQRGLAERMGQYPWVSEVLSRSADISRSTSDANPRQEKSSDAAPQLVISQLGGEQVVLPAIRRDTHYSDNVFIPRILWGLEWARIKNLGPITASQIAGILTQHGELDVPNTNVARAFRTMAVRSLAAGLWSTHGRRYAITAAGTTLLQAILSEV